MTKFNYLPTNFPGGRVVGAFVVVVVGFGVVVGGGGVITGGGGYKDYHQGFSKANILDVIILLNSLNSP